MLALTLAIGVSGGGSVLGWTFPNPMKVLYVDGEQSRNTLFNRLPLLIKSVPGADEKLCRKNLTLSAATMQSPEVCFFDIANHDQVEPTAEMVKAQGFGLVVFDNMTTLTDVIEDENDSAQVKKFQKLFTALKAANVADMFAIRQRAADSAARQAVPTLRRLHAEATKETGQAKATIQKQRQAQAETVFRPSTFWGTVSGKMNVNPQYSVNSSTKIAE